MNAELVRSLEPGDRILVNPLRGQPPRAELPAECVYVGGTDDPRTARACVLVCGLPEGWDDEPNDALSLRVLWADQVLQRLTESERVERMRTRLHRLVDDEKEDPAPLQPAGVATSKE